MSKFNWRNGFAIGLVAGIGLVIIAVLSLEALSLAINPTSDATTNCTSGANDCANDSKGVPDWRYWPGKLFAFEDTVAQWIMMAFTVAAAGLLLATLRATQEMARDTREIGEAQVRAYLSISHVSVTVDLRRDELVSWDFHVWIKNSGQSPAKDVIVKLAKEGQLSGTESRLYGDIPASNDAGEFFTITSSYESLIFMDDSQTITPISVEVLVDYRHVFGGAEPIEDRFVGRLDLVHGESAVLKPITKQAATAVWNDKKS